MSSLASLYRSALSASETDSVRERAGSRHSALPDERTLQLSIFPIFSMHLNWSRITLRSLKP